jgi:peroxiredoxin
MPKLQDQLDQITANTRNLVQPERLEISERAVAELYAAGVEDRILPVGSRAPEFVLPDAGGRLVRSSDLLALGPLVINFFRGRWCPYCVTELETWRDLYGAVRKRGALLIGISPQTVRQNDFTAVQHGLGFPVLTDGGCRVAAQFGLAYSVAPSQQQYYRSILVNIPLVNGDASWRLPLPATYILGRDGTVLFADAHADFRVRPEPRDVLDVLGARTVVPGRVQSSLRDSSIGLNQAELSKLAEWRKSAASTALPRQAGAGGIIPIDSQPFRVGLCLADGPPGLGSGCILFCGCLRQELMRLWLCQR